VVGLVGHNIPMLALYPFDYGGGFASAGRSLGSLKSMGLRPKFIDKLEQHGVRPDPRLFMLDGHVR
jgi:pilus assembly protein CpaF